MSKRRLARDPERLTGHLRGWGACLPERCVSNQELGEHLGVTADWIESRTGIRHRHLATGTEDVVSMATAAGRAALASAGVAPEGIDLILLATSTANEMTPAAANRVQGQLGASRAAAMQINAGCTGFISALVTAQQFIANGAANRVLVVGAEELSGWLNWKDPATCSLFGDAAAAVVLVGDRAPGGIVSHTLGSDGLRADLMKTPMPSGNRAPFLPPKQAAGAPVFEMSGPRVARFAATAFSRTLDELLAAADLSVDELALVIPHQANPRVVSMAVRRSRVPMAKVFSNADVFGNTSAASVPLALCHALDQDLAGPGDLVALVAFGAGLAWGGVLIRLSVRPETC